MLNKWNNQFSEWSGSELWLKLTQGVAIVSFAVPFIWATWGYWGNMWQHIPENGSFFLTTMMLATILLVYVLAFGVLSWIWAYASIAIGFAVSTICLLLIWLYRKICP